MWLEKFASRRLFFVCVVFAGVLLLALVSAIWYARGQISHPVLLTFWWIGNGALIYHLYPLTKHRRRLSDPPATGRIVAIVGVLEQSEDELRACIWSILDQRGVVVDEVHVVDHGSTRSPVQPFAHPRIRWHRTGNGGNRAAQLYVLDRLEPDDWDFVLAVDVACVLDEHAMERQLVEFSQPHVMATTAMVSMRNAGQNVLTRLVDLSVGTRVIGPAGRSALHAVQITPGALAVYRASVLFRHKGRYLSSAADDDHGLAMYPHLEGELVRVTEAIVWTTAPTDVAGAYRQSVQAAMAWWRVMSSALTRDPSRTAGSRLLVLLRLVLGPLWTAGFVIFLVEATYSATPRLPWLILYGTLYLLVRYARAGLYLSERPAMGRPQKWWTWILLTPVEAVYHLVSVGVIRYVALLAHRRARGSGPVPRAATSVYYSGFLSEKTKS